MCAAFHFLLFSCVLGVLVSDVISAGIQDGYVLNDQGKPVKIASNSLESLSGVSEAELPNRVFFYLYTRSTWTNGEKLILGDANSVGRSHFSARRPTRFVIHGWQNSGQSKTCTSIRDAFLQNGDYNVIVVDWGSITKFEYVWTSNQVVKVGQFVARMIDFLTTQGLDVSKTIVVGHSLGAHVAGLSSYYAHKKVASVVAMDPAGPNFHGTGPGQSLHKGDASYVQVIHTSNMVGMGSSMGDADFYPNGGSGQSGCGADLGESCSHSRSHEFYAESINSNRFVGRACNSYDNFKSGRCNSNAAAIMGGATPNSRIRGTYYLSTNSKSPYARG
nr:PREDICTED: pancreatic triacylglycerol lipase-like [Megachile rotundata]